MFEKISRMAEKAATNVSVSRRGFLGRLGQSALGVAAVLAGVKAATAQSGGVVCCKYNCLNYYGGNKARRYTACQPYGTTCYSSVLCKVTQQHHASSCDKCY